MSSARWTTKDHGVKNSNGFPAQEFQNQQIRVSLGKLSLRTRLEAYYSLVAPETLADQRSWRSRFEQIYNKYGGSYEGEKKLGSKLSKKYGTAVCLLIAQPARSTEGENKHDEHYSEGQKHDEGWYQLRPDQMGSGEICFTSTRFDAEATLREPEAKVANLNPFLTECALLDTVGQFAFHLPSCDPLRRDPVPSKTPLEVARNSQLEKKRPRQVHPFESVADSLKVGPSSFLHRSRHKRVKVLVRYVNSIRGTLTGTLLAFDKHANMILKDVEEVYSPRAKNCDHLSKVEIEKSRRSKMMVKDKIAVGWSLRHRRMKQILLRGDSVVLVYREDQERKNFKLKSKGSESSLCAVSSDR